MHYDVLFFSLHFQGKYKIRECTLYYEKERLTHIIIDYDVFIINEHHKIQYL